MKKMINCAFPLWEDLDDEELTPAEREVAERIDAQSDAEINGGGIPLEELKGFENLSDERALKAVYSLRKKECVVIDKIEDERPSAEEKEVEELILDRAPEHHHEVWSAYTHGGLKSARRLINKIERMPNS